MKRSTRPSQKALLATIVGLALTLGLAACGGGSSGSSSATATSAVAAATGTASTGTASTAGLAAPLAKKRRVTLILDFIPNAVHAGIYDAIAAGYYKDEHIDLKVIQPTSTADTLKLIDAGKAEFGLADGLDVGTQIGAGRDAEAIMAIAQRPLGGLITLASEHLTSAAQLQGKTVGITGVPSDTAVLDTVVSHAGGNPAKVHTVTIGFNGAPDLQAGKIAAFTGFWPDDGVQLEVTGHPVKSFKLDENGGPAYPGLVAFTTQKLIASDPALVRAFVAATSKGYEDAVRHPARALGDLLRLNPALQRKFTSASLNAYLPLFTEAGKVPFGELQSARIAELSTWMVQHKLLAKPFTPQRYGSNSFHSAD
jgi:putative hydroxymethylpyrimidine transport system substrate-binding protein